MLFLSPEKHYRGFRLGIWDTSYIVQVCKCGNWAAYPCYITKQFYHFSPWTKYNKVNVCPLPWEHCPKWPKLFKKVNIYLKLNVSTTLTCTPKFKGYIKLNGDEILTITNLWHFPIMNMSKKLSASAIPETLSSKFLRHYYWTPWNVL